MEGRGAANQKNKGGSGILSTTPLNCPGQESNLHALRRYHLKVVRLPISPPGLVSPLYYTIDRVPLKHPERFGRLHVCEFRKERVRVIVPGSVR
jgi:hypothetical protein